jgi:simple sugar transport system permease protein
MMSESTRLLADALRAPPGRMRRINPARLLVSRPELTPVIGLLAAYAIFGLWTARKGFFTEFGQASILTSAANVGILGATVTLLMITGEFDLSVGSVIGASSVLMAFGLLNQFPFLAVVVAGVGFGVLVGSIHGLLIVRLGLPSLMVTLATQFALRGVAIVAYNTYLPPAATANLRNAIGSNPLVTVLSTKFVGDIPISVGWWILLSVAAALILTQTSVGNWILAIGGSPADARAIGVPMVSVKICLFILTSLTGVLIATMQLASLGSVDALRGTGTELEAAVAAIIGGVLITGGYGSPIGTMIGALTLGAINEALLFAGVSGSWYSIALDLVLLGTILMNHFAQAWASESHE